MILFDLYRTEPSRYLEAYVNCKSRSGQVTRSGIGAGKNNDGFLPATVSNVEIILKLIIGIGGNKRFVQVNRDGRERKNYIFRVFKSSELILEEIRPERPEVELITGDCQSNDTSNEIKIEKLPYLERVEVRNQRIETIYVSPLDAPLIQTSALRENCLHVYKTAVTAPPVLSEYVPIPGVFNPYQFVAEICSDPECLPPQFEVICDCDCRGCPEGTCSTPCGSEICCNNTVTGLLVETIPVEEYCEGGS